MTISVLASKATGYPLNFVAARLVSGIPLSEISNSVTKSTCASFEPSLDYDMVKIPRWDLRKIPSCLYRTKLVDDKLGRGHEHRENTRRSYTKAIRSLDFHSLRFNETNVLISIDNELQTPSDQLVFAIANAMQIGYPVDKIREMTKIDKWFLRKLKGLSDFGRHLNTYFLC